MTWGLQQRDYPILTPGQMSPFNQAFQSGLENYMNINKAALDPLKTYAQAMSQLTYSNLMGPQYLAKLYGIPGFVANTSDNKKKQDIENLRNAAMNQPTTNAPYQHGGLYNAVMDLGNRLFGQSKQAVPAQSSADRGYEYDSEGNNVIASPEDTQAPTAPSNVEPTNPTLLQEAMNAWMQSPEAKKQADTEGYYQVPGNAELLDWFKRQNPRPAPAQPAPIPTETPKTEKTYEEKEGEYKGIIKEAEKLGEVRGTQIGELNDTYDAALTNKNNLDKLGSIISSPQFRDMRQLAIGGGYELGYFARKGTPEQKEMVGKLKASIGQVVTDAAGKFKGAFRVGEQDLIDKMKINENDPVDVAIGKYESLAYLNELALRRSSMAAQLMQSRHITKAEALEIARDKVPGDKVMSEIEDNIHAPIQVRNKKTGQMMTVTVTQARRLGVPNV